MSLQKNYLLIILLTFLQLQSYSQCIEGDGIILSNTLNISTVNVVEIGLNFNELTIKEGNSSSVEATGDSNILDSLNISVTNGNLLINLPQDTCFSSYNLDIIVTVSDLKSVQISGTGEVTLEEFTNSEELNVTSSGSSNITINKFEIASTLNIINSGSGTITIEDDFPMLGFYKIITSGSSAFYGCLLSVDTCQVLSSGSSTISVNAEELITGTISGTTTLQYLSSPLINVTTSGSATIIEGSDTLCQNNSVSVIEHQSTEEYFSLFPNPSNNVIFIQDMKTPSSGNITNLNGVILKKFSIVKSKEFIDISDLQTGMYILTINQVSKRFIKK